MTIHYIDSGIDAGDIVARKEAALSFLPALLLLAFGALAVLPAAAAERPSVSEPQRTAEAGPDGDEEGERPLIESIRVETGVADRVGVFFKLNGLHPPKCFSLVGEDRKLVCDFIATDLARDIGPNITIESDLVFRIRIGQHLEPERKTRVVLDMDRAGSYDVEQLFVKGKNEYVLVIKPLADKKRRRPAP